MKRGLYSNIHAKRERIAAGSKEKMRKPGTKGAPTARAFKQAAKTAKKK
jgi:cysteine sulfinate desulfinase/cysteine desulfurase-like protein